MKVVQPTSESFESEKWLHKNRSAQTHPQIARITAASVLVECGGRVVCHQTVIWSVPVSTLREPELTAAYFLHRAASALTATGSSVHPCLLHPFCSAWFSFLFPHFNFIVLIFPSSIFYILLITYSTHLLATKYADWISLIAEIGSPNRRCHTITPVCQLLY